MALASSATVSAWAVPPESMAVANPKASTDETKPLSLAKGTNEGLGWLEGRFDCFLVVLGIVAL